jgi:sortase (surface protein transpeptidase)
VSRDATDILNPTPTEQLTLYTCTDLAASRRLVVIARPNDD